jgi:hypothetical protein
MTATCPNGHQSATSDYCDQCGARIEGAGDPAGQAPAAAAPVAEAPVAEAPAATPTPERPAEACPVCGAPRTGDDRFCEGCGYDFTSGTAAASSPATAQGAAAAASWELVVTADRAYFERLEPSGVEFPAHCPPRTFTLTGDEVRIGRRSSSRGIQPEVDLSGAPEDSAISHLHAMLIRQPDGSYAVLDPGSTNGTTVNDNTDPITTNVPVRLADGDRIHLGAWTTITLHSRPV